MLSIFLLLSGGLFVATYQPIISTFLNNVNAQRQQAFWTPPLNKPSRIETPPPIQPEVAPTGAPAPKKLVYLGIFGDSTNQCCSATGAFWPRLLAGNFNWQFSDYSKPSTTFINSGVGNNNCERSQDCPSVKGQLLQASKKNFDVISISSGFNDCALARSNPQELRQAIAQILQDFRQNYPTAVIFTTSLTLPDIRSKSECNALMNSIIQSASDASDVMYLDVSKVITDPLVQLTRDTSHLNELGHALMGKKVINLLRKQPELSKLLEK